MTSICSLKAMSCRLSSVTSSYATAQGSMFSSRNKTRFIPSIRVICSSSRIYFTRFMKAISSAV